MCNVCLNTSVTYEAFSDIPLSTAEIEGKLENAISYFFTQDEVLKDECKYSCDTCKTKTEAIKKFKVKRAPGILALTLKR